MYLTRPNRGCNVLHRWAWILIFAVCCSRAHGQATELRNLRQEFSQTLTWMIEICEKNGLAEQAAITKRVQLQAQSSRYYYLPGAGKDDRSVVGNELIRFWQRRFTTARAEYASKLFTLAKKVAVNDEALAYRLLCEVLYHQPNHSEAGKVLRVSSRQVVQSKTMRTAEPQIGWRARRYWQVTSPHFAIMTNMSPTAGADLARKLEGLRSVWQQVFYPFWAVPGALQARLAGRDTPLSRSKDRHQVVFFKGRREYATFFAGHAPQIQRTVGFYSDTEQRSYFYAVDDINLNRSARRSKRERWRRESTWYHEATHQLLQESPITSGTPGKDHNFWAVEGIATFMESLRLQGQVAELGGFQADRLQFARYRKYAERYYVPLEKCIAMGRADVQESADIGKLYSQFAGLSHLLMEYDQGAYQQSFLNYLAAIYTGKATANSLPQMLQQPLAKLDQDYHSYLLITDDDTKRLGSVDRMTRLSWGRTKVSDVSLAVVRDAKELQWVDLSFTPVTDRGVAYLAGAKGIDQLSLESTKITDAALDTVRGFQDLEELDLSGTPITDRGLAKIAGLRKLKRLWLTNTKITDRGLKSLEGLRLLEELDTQGTEITIAARQKLQKKLSKLE